MTTYNGQEVLPCPEGCEKSFRVHGCEEIIKAPVADGSCWWCGGVGFVERDTPVPMPTAPAEGASDD